MNCYKFLVPNLNSYELKNSKDNQPKNTSRDTNINIQ